MKKTMRIELRELSALPLAAVVWMLVSVLLTSPLVVAQQPSGPTRGDLIETLQTIMSHLEKEQYSETEKLFYLPADFKPSMLKRLVRRKVISRPGITALQQSGQFGMATAVARKAEVIEVASEFNVPLDQCYAMKLKQGLNQSVIIAHWNEGRFKILDINGVGKMVPADGAENAKADVSETANPKSSSNQIDLSENNAGPAVKQADDAKSSVVENKIAEDAAEGAVEEPVEGGVGADVTNTGEKSDSVIDNQSEEQFDPAVVPEKSASVVPATVGSLPVYETDPKIAMDNYPAIASAVAENPTDIGLRAKFVQTLLVVGNTPQAWKHSREIYQMDPDNVEVIYAIDQSVKGLKASGIFQVGVPRETFESLMGKPLKETTKGEVVQWDYPLWSLKFNQGRFIQLTRVADGVGRIERTAVAKSSGEGNARSASADKATADKATSDKAAIDAATGNVADKQSAMPKSPNEVLAQDAAVEENLFSLKLVSYEKRLSVISTFAAHKDMPLKDIMKLIETPPVVMFDDLTFQQAEVLKQRFATKGAVTEILSREAAAAERKRTSFAVELSDFGDNKIAVIKAVRKLRKGIRLMEAKKLVEATPTLLLEQLTKKDAAAAVAELKAAGAAARVK